MTIDKMNRSRIKHRVTRLHVFAVSKPPYPHYLDPELFTQCLIGQPRQKIFAPSVLIDQSNDLERSTFPVYIRDKMKPRESLSYRCAVIPLPSISREENLRV